MLRLCNICNCEKPYDPSAKRNAAASGFQGMMCWGCMLNRDRARMQAKRGTAAGREASREAMRKWHAKPENRAVGLAWAKNNPDMHTAKNMRYKAAKLNRTPPWADHDKIKELYGAASQAGYEVDHVVPLQGLTVSGLHVHQNLQLLPKSVNCGKCNRWDSSIDPQAW